MTSKSLRFTDEEVNKANNINIMEYATHKGLELTKVSRDSYHINGFGGLYENFIRSIWHGRGILHRIMTLLFLFSISRVYI